MSRPLRRIAGSLARAALAAAFGWLTSVPLAGTAAASDSLTVTIIPRDVWPPAPVTDLAAVPGAEGQMLLTWTAPDGNTNALPALSPAAGYQIRIATFSADSAGSTTTWWNKATDVRWLAFPAVPVVPSAPAFPGTAESLLLNGLEPGVTYYAMIISSDTMSLVSDADVPSRTPGAQAKALVFDAQPPAPPNLAVVQTGPAAFTVSWSSPTGYDFDHYRVYYDSSAPLDFGNAVVLQISTPALGATITGLSLGTYVFRVTLVDKGVPNNSGVMLESLSASTVTAQLLAVANPAQAPFGIAVSSAMGGGVTLRWLPVERFDGGAPFAAPSSPTALELTGYRVYRATSAVFGGWSHLISVGTATLSWTDLAGTGQHYYTLRSENASGLSERSVIRTLGSRSAYVLAPDDYSHFEITEPDVAPIEGVAAASAYLVRCSSHPEDLGGRVVKSIEFKAWRGGVQLEPDFEIQGLGWIKLRYGLSSGTTVSPSAFASGVSPAPDNMSVYWHNGRGWVQLYGKLDALNQTMVVQAKYFGRYQLRTVERVGSFNFNQAGLSNRLVTPNGDGKNDNVEFRFDNPRDSQVALRILDLRGKVVASDVSEAGSTGGMSSRVWRPGASVPGGVYIYQLEAEGKTFTGTLVIVK